MTPTPLRRKVLKIVFLCTLGLLFVALADLLSITHESVQRRLAAAGAYGPPFDLELFRERAGETFARPVRLYFGEWGPPPGEWDPYESALRDEEGRQTPIERKTLAFDVNPERLVARFYLRLPKSHPLFKSAQTDDGQRHPARLAEDALGSVRVNGAALEFESLHSDFTEEGETGSLVLVGRRVGNAGGDGYHVVADFSAARFRPRVSLAEVVFDTTKSQVGAKLAHPVSRSTTSTRYVVEPYLRHTFHVSTEAAPPSAASARTVADYLSREITLPAVGTLLYGLYQSLPYLLFLWWARRYAAGPEARGAGGHAEVAVRAVKLYLIFHVGYFFLRVVEEAYFALGNPTILALNSLQQTFPLPFRRREASTREVLIPALLLFLYVWPSSIRRVEAGGAEAVRPGRLRAVAWWAALLALFGALAAWAAAPVSRAWGSGYQTLPSGDFYIACYGVLLLGLLCACVCLAFGLFSGGAARGALLCFATFGVVLLLSMPTGHYWIDLAASWSVFVAGAVSLVAAFLRLTFDLLAGRPFAQFWRGAPGGRGGPGVVEPRPAAGEGVGHLLLRARKPLIALGVLLVALSFKEWSADMAWRPLWSLGAELGGFFFLALGGMLVLLLKRMAAERYWGRLPDPVYHAGLLLALLTFFSPTGQWWFYVPVPFVLGYFMLDRWLLGRREYEEELISKVKRRVGEIVMGVIACNETDRLSRSLRKEMPARIGKGEVEYATYRKKLKEVTDEAESQRQQLLIEGRSGEELVFSFGPTDSPWKNGLIGAKYSLYISVFWFLLYLRSIVNSPAPEGSYAVLSLLNLVLSFLATWTAYGFFFGYFYPYLRGSSGYRKGLAFFFALSVPYLITHGLSSPNDPARWASFAFLQLQLLVHMVLLGLLAGDLETLRRARLGGGHLVQFYRLSSVTAWAATLVIAVGGAITTLVQSGATQILALALRQMGLSQEMDLPNK